MGVNDFNIPREREVPFYKMIDDFFSQLSDSINNEKQKLKEEESIANQPNKKPDSKEVHIHVHTDGNKTDAEYVKKEGNAVIQVLFDKDIYTLKAAQRWLRDNGYYYDKFDITDNFIRFQQRDYRMYDSGTFKVVNISESIKTVTADPVKKIGDI